jgi:uncharacterized surface protein with fasciclin (FAS1) repeats
MQQRQCNIIRPLSFFAGIIGAFALANLPVHAQTAPSQSPLMEQPGNTAAPSTTDQPDNTAPPTTGQPGNTAAPSTGQPGNTPTTPANVLSNSENQSPTELLQQVSAAGSFNTLARAVQAAGLSGALQQNGGRYTIFAPTDEAFAELPQGALERLLRPENRDLLRRVLAYHVVPIELASNELRSGAVNTLGGGIAVRVTPERIIVNNGSVIRPNIQTQNGIVHVVNRVLIPSELRQQLTSLQ